MFFIGWQILKCEPIKYLSKSELMIQLRTKCLLYGALALHRIHSAFINRFFLNCSTSDIQHYRYGCRNPMGLSKSLMETNYLQDDMMFSGSQDFDSVSVCSTASSSCSRDRRSPYNVHMGVSKLSFNSNGERDFF